ncbi:hypothetical protein [Microseira sp. BLCC-F43]|uniref:hypothetical protein n=1 Tax=Microseira sp. BLCC-F43 TaxID=3153602 RepID=UPI0035B85EC7
MVIGLTGFCRQQSETRFLRRFLAVKRTIFPRNRVSLASNPRFFRETRFLWRQKPGFCGDFSLSNAGFFRETGFLWRQTHDFSEKPGFFGVRNRVSAAISPCQTPDFCDHLSFFKQLTLIAQKG